MQEINAKLPDTFLCSITFNQSHASVSYGKIIENENNVTKKCIKTFE